MAGVITKLLVRPGEMQYLAGGTRNKINLNRPWQMDLPYAPDKCPFCTKEEEEAMPAPESWRVLGNPMTPHHFHRLIIPKECTTKEYVHILGGEQAIREALSIYETVIPVAANESFERTSCAVHVGYLGGQGLGHLHWHVCDAKEPESLIEQVIRAELREERLLFAEESIFACVEGAEAGQVFLVPTAPGFAVADLASYIARVVAMYNEKFVSAQGLQPEYTVAVVCDGDGLRYATYVPVLSYRGFPARLAYTGDSYITLPWPHELTVEHLNS